MMFFRRRARYGKLLEPQISDELDAILSNAQTLADKVIQNCDDWSEGRAYAYALRLSLRKYHDAKTAIPTLPKS